MVNGTLIRETIKERGLKIKFVAKKMGLSHYGLQKKMDNITEFRVSEVETFCDAVGGLSKADMLRMFYPELRFSPDEKEGVTDEQGTM